MAWLEAHPEERAGLVAKVKPILYNSSEEVVEEEEEELADDDNMDGVMDPSMIPGPAGEDEIVGSVGKLGI
jgi:ABC-type nitrate/sulfonate/bicarbonate transport system substrate-binding protein